MPNTEVCSVAGLLAAGMDCAETLTHKTRSMNLDETIEFLEPQTGPKAKGAALCQSADDWSKQKIALEQACELLGSKCTYDMKSALTKASANIWDLQWKTWWKKKAQMKKASTPSGRNKLKLEYTMTTNSIRR